MNITRTLSPAIRFGLDTSNSAGTPNPIPQHIKTQLQQLATQFPNSGFDQARLEAEFTSISTRKKEELQKQLAGVDQATVWQIEAALADRDQNPPGLH